MKVAIENGCEDYVSSLDVVQDGSGVIQEIKLTAINDTLATCMAIAVCNTMCRAKDVSNACTGMDPATLQASIRDHRPLAEQESEAFSNIIRNAKCLRS